MKKLLKWGLIGLAVLVVISIIANSGDSGEVSSPGKTSQNNSENSPGTSDDSKQEDKTTAKIGEEFKLGEMTFKVEGIEEKSKVGDEYLNKTASGKFIVATITVTNNSKEAKMMDTSFFKLKTDDGTVYDSDTEASLYANPESNFFAENINPNLSKKGQVVFEVPEDASDLQMQVQTGWWGTEMGVIDLK